MMVNVPSQVIIKFLFGNSCSAIVLLVRTVDDSILAIVENMHLTILSFDHIATVLRTENLEFRADILMGSNVNEGNLDEAIFAGNNSIVTHPLMAL